MGTLMASVLGSEEKNAAAADFSSLRVRVSHCDVTPVAYTTSGAPVPRRTMSATEKSAPPSIDAHLQQCCAASKKGAAAAGTIGSVGTPASSAIANKEHWGSGVGATERRGMTGREGRGGRE